MRSAEESGRAIGPSPFNAFGMLSSVIIPLLTVTVLVLIMVQVQSRTEAGVAAFSELLSFGYAFGAGMVASVNPCGFFLHTRHTISEHLNPGSTSHPASGV